ncbi:NupC/NupG family nucleoside CNT transporter [Paludisphaera mucosa]|uniref:Nucleoside transporter C-terminal domain-containing protein n=1 Tax=Paludisphaera mucosa TaxID=3030827 RepID=A0ABT6F8B0_9BACT|nr:nucleoside transporter C-terminal domain-containing protein [Paludisphaera mucosa]MDG3003833.1 nucleoside transporter C-terminal domain-containing protein [Paludisphaera mucosa]
MRRLIPILIVAAFATATSAAADPGQAGGASAGDDRAAAAASASIPADPAAPDAQATEVVRVGEVEVRKGYRLTLGPWSLRFSAPEDVDLFDWADRLRGLVGMALILAIAVYLSTDRRAISRRVVFWGLALQWLFAILVLRAPVGVRVLREAGTLVESVLNCALDGARFVFGPALVDADGPVGFVFAFRVLPTVIFVAALFAVLYHLGVMQWIVRSFAVAMAWLMGISGAESLDVAASLFLGQTEAPLTIRPYLAKLTNSELMTVMTAGMAHVSGGVMAAYFAYGVEPRHVLTAVVMTAPGAVLLSKLLVPETEKPETLGGIRRHDDREDANILDAAARGTRDGLSLSLNIAAVLIAFVGLVALVNLTLSPTGYKLENVFGWALAPVAYLLGVPWEDCRAVGGLMGTRTVLNELIAFQQLDAMRPALMERSVVIASFALCGFANVSSIGIQIGGIGALAPDRRKDLARLGGRALLAGTMANFLSACIAGILL